MNAAAATTSGSDLLVNSVEFLKYGPIGLAGLMLVLTIIGVVLVQMDRPQAALLKQFLYVGAFCFVIASIFAFLPGYVNAAHMLHFRIEPTDLGQTRALPAPIVTINSEVLRPPPHFQVTSETTAIIDVSDAINFVNQYKERDARQTQVLSNLTAQVTSSVPKLQQINQIARSDGCPGGAHGIPIPNGPALAEASSSVLTSLQNAKAAVDDILREPPPSAQ